MDPERFYANHYKQPHLVLGFSCVTIYFMFLNVLLISVRNVILNAKERRY